MENRSEKTYIEKTALLDFFGGIIEKLSPYEIGPDGRWVDGDEKRYRWTKEIMDGIEKLPEVVQPDLQPNCNQLATDCISRQAAIDALFELYEFQRDIDPTEAADLVRQGIYLAEKKIEQLPSAQPEPSQVARDIATIIENEKDMRVIAAQPEPIRINLNEPIKVKLTDWGKEIYYHQYDRTNQIAGREICKPRFPREDENGYTEFQLWCFIELYGMHMGMTLPNVIEPLEIVYER